MSTLSNYKDVLSKTNLVPQDTSARFPTRALSGLGTTSQTAQETGQTTISGYEAARASIKDKPMPEIKLGLLPRNEGFYIGGGGINPTAFLDKDFDDDEKCIFNDLVEIEKWETFDKVSQTETESKTSQPTKKTKRDLSGVPVYGSVDIFSKGIAGIFNIHNASTSLEKQIDVKIKFENELFEKIKEAKEEGDSEKLEKLYKVLSTTGDMTKPFEENLTEELEKAPTNMQVVGASAELALLASFGYGSQHAPFKFGLTPRIAKPTLQLAKNAGLSAKITHYGKKYALGSLSSGSSIALWTAAGEAKIEDSSVEDIINAGERGFKLGMVLGPAFMATGDLASAGIKWAGPKISKHSDKLFKKLEKVAAGKDKMPKTAIERGLEGIKQSNTLLQGTAKVALKARGIGEKFQTKFIDRFNAIKRMEDKIYGKTGRPLLENEKVYRDVRMLQEFADGLTEKKVNSFISKMKKYDAKTRKYATSYLNTLSNLDRAKAGQSVYGGKTVQSLKYDLADIARQTRVDLGPNGMQHLREIRKLVVNYNKGELVGMVRSGLISQKEMEAMIKANPNYIPHKVITDHVQRNLPGISQSTNVSETTLKKAIGTLTKEHYDPIQAMFNKSIIVERVKQKNILLNNIINANTKHKIFKGAKKLTSGQKPSEGFGTINMFNNGSKETWQVPQNIVNAIKGTDVPISGSVWTLATAPSRLLRKGATQYNPGFILRNKFRDMHQAALISEAFIQKTGRKYGLNKNIKKYTSKQIDDMYRKGGLGADIFTDGADRMRESLMSSKLAYTFKYDNKISINPLKAIQKMNTFVEQSTRKSVAAKGLFSGLSPKDAVWVSRNATVDFAKMGEWMRPANQAIPFLNARVQGLTNLPKAFLASPDRFTEAITQTAVIPTLLLHQHNRRYESYKYINQGIKELDWVIMTGEVPAIHPYTNEEILVPQFITLKRGEGQNLVSAPIRHWLESEDEIDDRNVSQMLADMFGSNSPVDFGTYSRNQQNVWSAILAQFGPLTTIPAGGSTGKHPYWGSDIVHPSRQEAHRELHTQTGTPEILKDIPKEFYRSEFAERLNISPAMIEFYVSTFGGLPQDVLKATDIAYGVVREGKMGGLRVTDTPWEKLTETPIIKGFLRQTVSTTTEGERREVDEVKKDIYTENLADKDLAYEIASTIERTKDPQEIKNYINTYGDKMLDPDFLKLVTNRLKVNATVSGLRASESNAVKSSVIISNVEKIKKEGGTQRDVLEYISELTEAKIINEAVAEELLKYGIF